MGSNFDFKIAAVPIRAPAKKSTNIKALAVFKVDKMVAYYNGEYYEIVYDISKYQNLYSMPNNDKHKEWTKRKVENVNEMASMYWTPFKNKSQIKGNIINNKFVVE